MKISKIAFSVVALTILGVAAPVWALDGCKVLLCLAGPWQKIPDCVSEVQALFRSLSEGEPFPACSFVNGSVSASTAPGLAGASNVQAQNAWLGQWMPVPDAACPARFVTTFDFMGATRYGCRFDGVVSVYLDGRLWSRTLWSPDGASFYELSDSAQVSLSAQSPTAVSVAPSPPRTDGRLTANAALHASCLGASVVLN